MSIRKTGAATGRVIEVEDGEVVLGSSGAITATGAVVHPPWADGDELALADENEAADQ